jgi:hypothetical protein
MVSTRLLFLLPAVTTWWLLGCHAAVDTMYSTGDSSSSTAGQQPKSQSPTGKARREGNLDHWDGDTLAFYLDNYVGVDVAVMFYAPWDRNSHSLAPLWDQIATHLDAGSSDSRLIMALFDCELNHQHIELCKAVSITHYPTLMFIGAGPYHDTDPLTGAILGASKSAGLMGRAPIWNTVKFQGNWQYGDSIMDWIRTMQALSNWHTWSTEGFGKKLRTFFWPHRKGKKTSLPIGIPPPGSGGGGSKTVAAASASSASGDSSNTAKVQSLEVEMESLKQVNGLYETAVNRVSVQIDSLLFPTDAADSDVFQSIYTNNGWEPEVSDSNDILLTCALEISLEYCQRVATHVATELVNALEVSGGLETISMDVLEKDVQDLINKKEPFCKVLETCLATGMQGDECRPTKCPFENEVACRYVASCLDPTIQAEYREVMGLGGGGTGGDASTGTSGAAFRF